MELIYYPEDQVKILIGCVLFGTLKIHQTSIFVDRENRLNPRKNSVEMNIRRKQKLVPLKR